MDSVNTNSNNGSQGSINGNVGRVRSGMHMPVLVLALCVLIMCLYSVIASFGGDTSESDVMGDWQSGLEVAQEQLPYYRVQVESVSTSESEYSIIGDSGLAKTGEEVQEISSWLMQFSSFYDQKGAEYMLDQYNVSESDISLVNELISAYTDIQMEISVLTHSSSLVDGSNT